MALKPQPLPITFSGGVHGKTDSMLHGFARRGQRGPLYNAWRNMRQRCLNDRRPDFKYYGGRGIRVCARWDSFEAFAADMGPCPRGMTLDRIDTDGHYCKRNCRWATRAEQSRNRREFVTANEIKTHCKFGHPFDEANTRINATSGGRQCRACDAQRARRKRAN